MNGVLFTGFDSRTEVELSLFEIDTQFIGRVYYLLFTIYSFVCFFFSTEFVLQCLSRGPAEPLMLSLLLR